MGKIKNQNLYPIKIPVATDYIIGSDSENEGETVNFQFDSFVDFVNSVNGNAIISYIFATSPIPVLDENGYGYFLSENNIVNPGDITKLKISKKTKSLVDLTPLFQFLGQNTDNFTLKLRNLSDPNNFLYLNLLGVTEEEFQFTFTVEITNSNNFLGNLLVNSIYGLDFNNIVSIDTTDDLPEGDINLYFTVARVLSTLLTGLDFTTGGSIASTDTILQAFGKLQNQLSSIGLQKVVDNNNFWLNSDDPNRLRYFIVGDSEIATDTFGWQGRTNSFSINESGFLFGSGISPIENPMSIPNIQLRGKVPLTPGDRVFDLPNNKEPGEYILATRDEINPGAIYSQRFFKNYFTSSTGFTLTSLTPSYVDGKMRLTGGLGNFNQYFTIDGLKNTDENIELELIFKATTVNTGSFGLAIGKKSINSWYDASVVCSLSPVQASAYLWDPTNTTQLGNKVLNSINSGDILKLKYTQIANVITCSYYNITQKTKGQFSITGNLSVTKNFKIPNSSDIRIYNLGGTMDIISIKVTSLSNTSPNIICIGDSKTVGYSASGNELRWASNINSLGTVITNAGDGDRTVEVIQTINYTKLLNAKIAILCIGRNDLGSGVSTTVWQLNYQNIVSELQNQGTKVIHLLPIPETVLADQSVLKNWIVSNYGIENCIDPSIGWSNATMLSTDNVHPNEVGHAHISNIIINSGLIESNIINRFPKINELDNEGVELTVNTSNYIPYANNTVYSDSDIYRISSGRYAQGNNIGYNFGTGFQTYEITGLNFGLLAVSKIGSTRRWYFSGDSVNGYIGLNNNGTNVNCLTLFPDGGVQYEELGNINSRSASAKIQIDSTTQGLLIPRMTNAQRLSITSPATGLMVYCTNSPEGLYLKKTDEWVLILDSKNSSDTILSSAPTLLLTNTSKVMYYTYTGSTPATWTLPTLIGNSKLRIVMYNTGTGIVTVNTNTGGNDIYDSGALVNTTSLNPGTRVEVFNNSEIYIMS